jgi:hypothetical protein
VTDAHDPPIAGAVQTGTGRMLIPKIGRVYPTVPLGEEQRIV